MMNLPQMWALNSAVECHPHTVEVIGSNPIAPTIYSPHACNHLRVFGFSTPQKFSPMESLG